MGECLCRPPSPLPRSPTPEGTASLTRPTLLLPQHLLHLFFSARVELREPQPHPLGVLEELLAALHDALRRPPSASRQRPGMRGGLQFHS